MENSKLLYEGKAKRVFATDDPEVLLVEYKNSLTALNGKKKDEKAGKGRLNNLISSYLFTYLASHGIPSHFIKQVDETHQLVKKVHIIPLETIVRNIAAGHLCSRYGIKEGLKFTPALHEFSYKSDELDDPLVYPSYAVAFGWATQEEVNRINELSDAVDRELTKLFDSLSVILVDFKLEFGRDASGQVLLADEISPDTCRFWDKDTGDHLDKDRFRKDLGNVMGAYEEIWRRLSDGRKK